MASASAPDASAPTRNVKAYKGNLQYVGLFNQHVTNHFSLHHHDPDDFQYKTRRHQVPPKRLQSSKISVSRAYYIPENAFECPGPDGESPSPDGESPGPDGESLLQLETQFCQENSEFRALPGTFWTSEEKHIFFNCLARYSIHRVEDIALHLPQKTVFEITAYYNLLKKELQRQKRQHRLWVRSETHPQRNHEGHHHPKRQASVELVFAKSGVPYSCFPIAKEMDEAWDEFEEDQSVIVADHAQVISSHKASHRLKELKQMTGDVQFLINNDGATALGRLYRANSVFPILEGKKSAKLTFESIVFLEEFIRLKTRELIAEVIIGKGLGDVGGEGTGTETETETGTETLTETETGTGTETLTETETGTGTETLTETKTGTGTETVTETKTGTGTETLTETETGTGTETVTVTSQKSMDQMQNSNIDTDLRDSHTNVRRYEVWSAAERLKMFETSVAGFKSRYRDGKTAVLDHYWQNVLTSLKPVTITEVSLFPPKPDNYYFERQVKDYMPMDSFAYEDTNSEDVKGIATVEARSLKRSAQDLEIEDDLIEAETEYLEVIDALESKRYVQALKKTMGISAGCDMNPDLSELNPNLSELNPNLSELNPDLSELNPNLSELNPNLSELNPNLNLEGGRKEALDVAWDKTYASY